MFLLLKNFIFNDEKKMTMSLNKIITFDIECYVHNSQHYPFAIGIYNGLHPTFFYLKDEGCLTPSALVNHSISYLFSIKGTGCVR